LAFDKTRCDQFTSHFRGAPPHAPSPSLRTKRWPVSDVHRLAMVRLERAGDREKLL
jgi:hypothetical protein